MGPGTGVGIGERSQDPSAGPTGPGGFLRGGLFGPRLGIALSTGREAGE